MNLLLFDCDGTLVDSQFMIVKAMDMAFALHNRPPQPREKTLSIVGLSLPYAIEVMLGKDDKEIDSISNAFKNAYHELRIANESEPLYPLCKQVLEYCVTLPNCVLGVATGKNMRGLKHVLAMHEIDQHFVTLQTADNAPSKPHPAMIEQAILETGATNVIMIGDTTFDMEMGLNAGVTTIGVTWGYHSHEALIKAGAHHLVDDYAALQGLLVELLKAS